VVARSDARESLPFFRAWRSPEQSSASPIDWPEPFGLVMTEGMSVTAWRKELVTEVTVLDN
jgi:hypothetical protein